MQAAIVIDGALHRWSWEASWLEALIGDQDALDETRDARQADDEAREEAEELAIRVALVDQVAHSDDYARAKNQVQRIRAITAAGGPDYAVGPTWLVRDILTEIQAVFESDVLPIIEANLASDAHALLAAGKSIPQTSRELQLGEEKLRRLLVRFPLTPS